MEAIRELLINALVHRDYQSPTDVQIKIFDNKISFFNPGGLYGNITAADLHTDTYQASTRNKQLAEAFYLTNDIEKYGSGFIRIREAISKYPSMKFSFRETGHGFVTEFSYAVQKISTDKVTDKVTDSLTDNQTTIVHLMRKNEHITTNEIAAKVKISQRKVKENISKLKELGIIERLGSAKGGYWKVLK